MVVVVADLDLRLNTYLRGLAQQTNYNYDQYDFDRFKVLSDSYGFVDLLHALHSYSELNSEFPSIKEIERIIRNG